MGSGRIPNFIDNQIFDKFCGCCRDQFAEDDEKILVHISNLRAVKRIQDVLETFKKVHQKVPSKLIIAGEGPDTEKITTFLLENPHLVDKIKLMGKLSDVYPVLTFADVFLLPSEQESFGLAALEAMAAGTPVVSSNIGGIPEVNIHERTGYLADVGDVEKMAEYTIKLLSDESLLKQMKKNAKEESKRFELNKVIPMYEELYQKTLREFKK